MSAGGFRSAPSRPRRTWRTSKRNVRSSDTTCCRKERDMRPPHIVGIGGTTRAGSSTEQAIRHALRGCPTPMGVAINSTTQRLGPGPGIEDEKARFQLETMAGEVMEFIRVRQAGLQPAGG